MVFGSATPEPYGLGVRVGDRVRIERDETRWRSRGSWPRYRGRVGTVVRINRAAGEIGVSWRRRPEDAVAGRTDADSWFLRHEATVIDVVAGLSFAAQGGSGPSEDPRVRAEP